MSTTDASPDQPQSAQVTLPPGVAVGAGRETSQINDAGIVVQGMVWPITLANGTTSTVFVPNSALGNVAQVEKIFADKVAGLSIIPTG